MGSNCCELCGTGRLITFHHLIPKSCHKNKWFRKNFSKEQMRESGIYICRSCHSFIHRQFAEKTLGRDLNSLQALLADEKIKKHIAWARKQY